VDLHGLYVDSFTFMYVDDFRTSQETQLWVSTACYKDSFTVIHVYDVRTSQETQLWASTGWLYFNLECGLGINSPYASKCPYCEFGIPV
jgi:hypothetical protein